MCSNNYCDGRKIKKKKKYTNAINNRGTNYNSILLTNFVHLLKYRSSLLLILSSG